MRTFHLLSGISVAALTALAACSNSDTTTSPASSAANASSASGAALAATLRLRCELRVGSRSKISVDAKGVPANASFRAGVRSAGVTVVHSSVSAIGDEVEFDFSSDSGDIAAGAQPIPADFITIDASGPDVQARVVDANGATVVQGGADCRVR